MNLKGSKGYEIQEAISYAHKNGYKIYPIPDRGGSFKSPPMVKLGYIKEGKRFVGKQKYSQEDNSIPNKINELYLKFYYENNPKITKEVSSSNLSEPKTESDEGSKSSSLGKKTNGDTTTQETLF